MFDSPVFKKVLMVGPNFKDHKGGMGAVLEIYHNHILHFNFMPSYEGNMSTNRNYLYFANFFINFFIKLLFNKSVSLVHIHGAVNGSFYRKYLVFLLGKYLFGKKIVYHIHAGDFQMFYEDSGIIVKKLVRHFVNQADCILVLSKLWLEYINLNFKPKKVIILNNPIETPFLISTKSSSFNGVIFLFMGHIWHHKGIFDLLTVLAQDPNHYSNKLILKIGGSGEVLKLKAFIEQNNLSNIVKYEGWVEGTAKGELFSSCDIFILPSYYEGLPMSILEAMSYGKPIFATKVGGVPEIVSEGENGFLINPGDIRIMKDKIDYIVNNKHILSKMGHESLKRSSEFEAGNIINQIEHLYEDLFFL